MDKIKLLATTSLILKFLIHKMYFPQLLLFNNEFVLCRIGVFAAKDRLLRHHEAVKAKRSMWGVVKVGASILKKYGYRIS